MLALVAPKLISHHDFKEDLMKLQGLNLTQGSLYLVLGNFQTPFKLEKATCSSAHSSQSSETRKKTHYSKNRALALREVSHTLL